MSESTRHPLSFYELEGEIELGRGDVISTIDLANFPGSYPVYSSSAVGLGEFGCYGRYMFDEELITWSIDGGGRPFHRKKHRYSVTNVCGFLRIKRPDIWDYRYLHALLEKLQSGIQFDYQMKAHPSVIRELYQFERAPIAEQRKIGQILDTLDTAIRETEALIDKLKAVKQGLLHDLLTRGIDANGQLRPPQSEAPQLYKESPLGWIPREWETTLLGACTSWSSGGTPSRAVASYWKGDVPLLTPKDMKSFELSDTMEHVSAAAANSGSRLMPAGTVFIVVRGMILAHSFPVVLAAGPMAFNQDVKAISAGAQLDPRFLAYWLVANTDGFLRKVTEATHGTKKLDMENLVGFPIGLPSLQEQAAITARLEAVSDKYATETEYLSQLSEMKTGLMDDLLTGRVRVTPLLESAQQPAAQTGA
ncbi:restriction endonuclease subunit S [Pseudomonas sp. CW003PS]|nr:restriction endonuclease subunit S [Pseudomonas sp. CW003PS]